ncbi:hypothetical protein Pr1d_31180 [Bythopirellula goksoeyrii]|uniref:Uncharacterized protein n=1 Tax=Bythopirellula goksoeyrii TaxID=1400387 RepID=A0A5B9QE83_9BACT|nr:hypothetical protein Pr1d_31180 [Bythopirellula goksoeyrii]
MVYPLAIPSYEQYLLKIKLGAQYPAKQRQGDITDHITRSRLFFTMRNS